MSKSADESETVLSTGERWSIYDLLDGTVAISFDSWHFIDPEERARQLFAVYPREADLRVETIKKFGYRLVDVKRDPENFNPPTDKIEHQHDLENYRAPYLYGGSMVQRKRCKICGDNTFVFPVNR